MSAESAGAAQPPGTVTVTGTGGASAVPDLLQVSIGVECRAAGVEEAYTAAGEALAAVTASLQSHGIETADVRTAGMSVRAELVWREGEGQQVAGYVASSMLEVRLRNLASASGTISYAVRAGGNDVRLNSMQLAVTDDAPLRERARAAAWADALRAARQFAGLASATLGRVLSVAENQAGMAPIPVVGLQRAGAVESIDVEPGETRVETAVTVVWELTGGQVAA